MAIITRRTSTRSTYIESWWQLFELRGQRGWERGIKNAKGRRIEEESKTYNDIKNNTLKES